MINLNKFITMNTKRAAIFGIDFEPLKKQFGELFLEKRQSEAPQGANGSRINTKRAAIFGIDARISLILVSIASLAIALNKQAFFESSKIQEISTRLFEVETAMMADYAENYKNSDFLVTGYASMTDTQKHSMFQGKTELYEDPWGNDWDIRVFESTSTTMMAFGQVITPVCIVVFSAGADGYHYKASNFTAATYDDCLNNVGLSYDETDTETNDDYFYKFTTLEYEVKVNEDTQNKLDAISSALYNYKTAKKNIRVNYCEGLSQSAANANASCDVDSSGTYELAELDDVNYYPKSSTDVTAAVYYSTTTYANSLAGMQNFLTEIGLPTTYANDLAGRLLNYNSNKNSSVADPYVAEFYYDAP